ncbi:type VI secretion system tip protein VgrG [Pseudomonas syringae]|nr:type VI secretion system tip protein VgrG [Pseudomonas syringae]MCF5071161.1 type VI secretion system tip protein VgrG [Pseudomonas syringae]
MLNDKESPFNLVLIDSGLCLPILRFTGHEALNQPYRFEIETVTLAPAQMPAGLLHQAAFLRIDHDHGIHGVLHSISCEHQGQHRIGYRLVLVPRLRILDQRHKRRVFVDMSVTDIVAQLLAEHGLPRAGYRLDVTVGHYPARPFCIQYDESDLALLHRLCEEEGIHYHFEHRPDGHVVVFADDSLNLPQTSTVLPFTVTHEKTSPAISALFQRHDAASIATLPAVRNRGRQSGSGEAANEVVNDWPALAVAPSPQRHAEQRSRRQLERQRSQYRSVRGRSDCGTLLSGHLLQVTGHPIPAFNDQWLITELRHQGQQPSILDPASTNRRYCNDFTAQPWSTDFRPPLIQPRPSIPGYHLARVHGNAGDPPTLDEQGQIAVQLWPEPEMPDDDHTLWLPIALTGGEGSLSADTLPRAGSEVWVSFLDGDPDRPILCLGARHTPPRRESPPGRDTSLLLDWLLNGAER